MNDGHENIGVSIVVLNPEKNKVLLGVRIGGYHEGWYGAPGGRIELRESILECGKRELNEEVGVETDNIEYVGVVRQLQKDSYNFIHFGLIVKEYTGEVKNLEPEKCEGWEWFSIENLPQKLLPGHKAVIEMYLNPETSRYRDLLTSF